MPLGSLLSFVTVPHIVEVLFKGSRKEFFLWEGEEALPNNVAVVVEADRGEDLGVLRAVGDLAAFRATKVPHRPGEEGITKRVHRLASIEDLKRNEELRSQDEEARRAAGAAARQAGLAMKVTDAEWRWDRRKLTLYFTAEKRVDFRELVRELAATFRTRIELKQIGVRDEAKRLGGIGRCGREYCSATWLTELRPVNLGVARDQRLSLNPTQISGACGRLMCCLRYEHDFYVAQRKRFPKEGKIISTSRGDEKVLSNDIFRERVTLRGPDGDVRTVPLAELRREWKNAPPQLGPSEGDDEVASELDEGLSDELLRLEDTAEMPTSGLSTRALPVVGQRERPARDRRPREPRDEKPHAPGRDTRVGPAPKPPPASELPEVSAEGSEPKGRRRRGRRGGRRGRGNRPEGPQDGTATHSTD